MRGKVAGYGILYVQTRINMKKALTVLFLFIVSGLLFRYIGEIIPEEIIPFIDYEPDNIKFNFQSEDWDIISEDELLREDYEIIKD